MKDPEYSIPKAAVLVEIQCRFKEAPPRWQMVLRKSLQSLLFSKDLPDNTELCDLDISPNNPFKANAVLNSVSGKK